MLIGSSRRGCAAFESLAADACALVAESQRSRAAAQAKAEDTAAEPARVRGRGFWRRMFGE